MSLNSAMSPSRTYPTLFAELIGFVPTLFGLNRDFQVLFLADLLFCNKVGGWAAMWCVKRVLSKEVGNLYISISMNFASKSLQVMLWLC